MTIKVYRCQIMGVTVYEPYCVNPKQPVLKFKERVIDKTDFLITNSLNKRIDKHIEYMLSLGLIDYANFDWKFEF